ncbi:MAG: molecular chaperone SurA [Betaproteobacteria bacterium RIFCSPLOWO2_12_FULL_62_58]|nr:MAG: molecular chaperone SurA [Betaproteobacteria bacterium RIFCSPLOWO2_02_FULL_62_79]OGA55233.1 MAG: molecular chaperone SurA [Betaproteobacteria bacterium RIFCSPLOWO2_12_FULL_62_58]
MLVGLAWQPPAWAQKPPPVVVLDRIVAVVNDEVITRIDLNGRVGIAIKQLRQQGTPLPPREVLERQLLDRMVTDRVQLHFAKETGLRVDDTELDRAIGRIAQENKLTLQGMRQALEKDGVPFPRFREDIRDEIVMARLREREVDARIVVSEGEIDNFLSLQQGQEGGSDDYNLSHILVVVPENASPEQIQARRNRAEQAHAQLKGGADFRQVAAAFSEAPDALQGGVMGWRQSSRLPTLFTDALKPMRTGELSPILRSPNGFHILRLNDKRGGGPPVMVQQTRARHILIKTSELVSENEARSRLRNLKERLENNADFAGLARAHSEDASATKGGDLGWLSPGDTVPEFERAMDALKPGQISDPILTPFGWHLIQVLERRNEDMSKERQRLMARQALRARKSDEAYQEWVRQLRDRAFIELRLEER